tara:strand:- start:591 stop:773 length:183 start_codon:yes stop_codon:yes gene_type:complete
MAPMGPGTYGSKKGRPKKKKDDKKLTSAQKSLPKFLQDKIKKKKKRTKAMYGGMMKKGNK